jgi:hypothetical protein
MFEMRFAAKIVGLGQVRRGHHVPTRAAAADMIERGEFPRHVIRLIVAGGSGGDEADALGKGRNRREQGDRVEEDHVLRPAAQRSQLSVTHSRGIGQEHQIEFAALGSLREACVMFEIRAGVDLGIRM